MMCLRAGLAWGGQAARVQDDRDLDHPGARAPLGSETAPAAYHVAALRLAAGAAGTGAERPAAGPTGLRTAL